MDVVIKPKDLTNASRFARVVPTLLASDLKETTAFYANLGFAIKHMSGEAGRVKYFEVCRNGFSLYFFQEPIGVQRPFLTGTIYIFPESVDALAQEWLGKVELLWGPELSPRGLYEFGISDPNDYFLAFAERPASLMRTASSRRE
jgi:catechol 2,3-dioxygenase-like lactoylglutathione lyase family enzyme